MANNVEESLISFFLSRFIPISSGKPDSRRRVLAYLATKAGPINDSRAYQLLFKNPPKSHFAGIIKPSVVSSFFAGF